jgi:hypothetical protein
MSRYPVPHAEVLTITPTMAMKFLERKNSRNPPIKQANIAKFANDMKNGAWKLNGEPVIIGRQSETILDGHHRLWSCIEANVAFQTLVVSNIDEDTFGTIDTGRGGRSWADAIYIDGIKTHHRPTATAAALAIKYETGKLAAGGKHKISNTDVVNYVAAHMDLHTWAEAASKGAMRPFAAPLAAALYLASTKYRNRAEDFLSKMISGADMERGNPILALRNRLLQGKDKVDVADRFRLIVQGWNAFVDGRDLSRMQSTAGAPFPKIRGAA